MPLALKCFARTVTSYERDHLPHDRTRLAPDVATLLVGEVGWCREDPEPAAGEFADWLTAGNPRIEPVPNPDALRDMLAQRVIRSLVPADWIGWLAMEGEVNVLTQAWPPRMFACGGPEAVIRKFHERVQPRRTPLTPLDVLEDVSPLDGSNRICRLARHAVNSYARLVRASAEVWDVPALDPSGDFIDPREHAPVPHDVKERVQACLDEMDQNQREVLYKRHALGLGCASVAHEMKLTNAAVHKLAYAAKARFRKNYQRPTSESE